MRQPLRKVRSMIRTTMARTHKGRDIYGAAWAAVIIALAVLCIVALAADTAMR